ncbi:hypothetical protein HY639_00975 [Candidatus Woesearchaeota archaeon]|nr:hypothetical protein [Candidatus Woesearchaeota archaeon]
MKPLLGLLAGSLLFASVPFTNLQTDTAQRISRSAANLAVLCRELADKKPKKEYTVKLNYADLSRPDLTRFGVMDYYLTVPMGEDTVTLALFTDRGAWHHLPYPQGWHHSKSKGNHMDHRDFMLYPLLPWPGLYTDNDETVIGLVLRCSNGQSPYIDVQDLGADSIGHPHPVLKTWVNYVGDYAVLYNHGEPVRYIMPHMKDVAIFNKNYAVALETLEKRLQSIRDQ